MVRLQQQVFPNNRALEIVRHCASPTVAQIVPSREMLHTVEIRDIFLCNPDSRTKFPPEMARRFSVATAHSPQSATGRQPKDFDEVDAHLLEQTVEKLVR